MQSIQKQTLSHQTIAKGFCGNTSLLLMFVILLNYQNMAMAFTRGSRTVQYGLIIKNQTNRVLDDVNVWACAPAMQSSGFHCCEELEALPPFEKIIDAIGNQVMLFHIDQLPPYGSKVVQIRAELSDSNNSASMDKPELFLKKEPFIESDHPDILGKAINLKGDTPLETAENIYKWVSENIQYSGYTQKARGALYALNNKKGDCTEFMYLFIALSRANNIPARGIGGYVVHGDAVLNPSQYHNWAEFYANGKWHIADPQRKQFMQTDADYIAMQILSDDENSFGSKGKRFWHSHEKEISVRMESGSPKSRAGYSDFSRVKEKPCSSCPD